MRKLFPIFLLLAAPLSAEVVCQTGTPGPCFLSSDKHCVEDYAKTVTAKNGQNAYCAMLELATLYWQTGEPEKARETAAKAAASMPDEPQAHILHGWILYSKGRADESYKAFEKVLSSAAKPDEAAEARLGMSFALLKSKKYKQATELLNNLYGRNPYTISLTAYLAALGYMGQSQPQTAMTYFQQALTHDSYNLPALIEMAAMYESNDNQIQAMQSYAMLSMLDPENKTWTGKMNKLAAKLSKPASSFLFYTRLNVPLQQEPAITASTPALRVALFSGEDSAPDALLGFEIVSSSSFTLTDSRLGEITRMQSGKSWSVEFNPANGHAQLRDSWGNTEYSSPNGFTITPGINGASILIKNARGSSLFNHNYGDKELKGTITVHTSSSGLRLVNTVPLEDFIPGAVAEAAAGIREQEALKALAVVIRTEAVEYSSSPIAAEYDFCDYQTCIPYGGINRENRRSLAAARDTDGEILVSTAGVGYHKACGGMTAGEVSDMNPLSPGYDSAYGIFRFGYKNPPAALYCAPDDPTQWSRVKWTLILESRDLQQRLERRFKTGAIKAVYVSKRDGSGRIMSVTVEGAAATAELKGFAEINSILAAKAMRSPLAAILPIYSGGTIRQLIIRGTGTGDGRGLCMAGAQNMAATGKTYKEILAHYFPSAGMADLTPDGPTAAVSLPPDTPTQTQDKQQDAAEPDYGIKPAKQVRNRPWMIKPMQ